MEAAAAYALFRPPALSPPGLLFVTSFSRQALVRGLLSAAANASITAVAGTVLRAGSWDGCPGGPTAMFLKLFSVGPCATAGQIHSPGPWTDSASKSPKTLIIGDTTTAPGTTFLRSLLSSPQLRS